MKLSIRPIEVNDIAEVYRQIIELGKYLNIADKIIISTDSLQEILFDGNPYSMKGIVAILNNNIVGFALYTLSGTNLVFNPTFCIYLDELYVEPKYRGQKIGTNLLKYVAQIADETKCNRIEWYVNDENYKGREFYLKIKAQEIEQVRVFSLSGKEFKEFLLTRN